MSIIGKVGSAFKIAVLYVPRKIAKPRVTTEMLGQFGVTALSGGGKLDDQYQSTIDLESFVSARISVVDLSVVMGENKRLGSFMHNFFLDRILRPNLDRVIINKGKIVKN